MRYVIRRMYVNLKIKNNKHTESFRNMEKNEKIWRNKQKYTEQVSKIVLENEKAV